MSSFTIFNVRILGVDREGIGHTEISILLTPGNRQFAYGLNRIYFDPTNPFVANEKVTVLYEA